MKIKKSFLAILAVFTLFAASASTSVSAFTSVEANAATHHKDTKKHKKAKKSSKRHKKATKKSKKKATKKHSKKKVAKKKKKVTKKKPAKKAVKKHVVKKPAGPTPITYSHPTITINPTGYDDTSFKVEYTNKQYKSYNDQMIYDDSGADTNPNQLYLKGITYYNLANSKYRTAMTLTLLVKNSSDSSHDYFDNNENNTYIASNNVAKRLVPAWAGYEDFNSSALNIPATSQQVVDLTFVGTDDSTPADFSSFTFNYTPDNTIAVNLNF
ncbi:hypothetical protein [Apilactobacillus kunkeei]|uniref:DUF5067 domain-containing protein n=1 Tax=Apilactobacillus kunkeei TaxID=148814 RepID=A0A0M9DGG8_9LACO|nr:hypothetical protein [Apilactobacillus kunkeei]KOY79854.1 hypothetical protein RZ72_04460 [Apilactobacillus kunkeei]